MRGTVSKSTGSWYEVLLDTGGTSKARIRGKLRLDNADTSNPIAVGDRVNLITDQNFEDTAVIQTIEPRRNYIIRKSNKLSAQRQVLAANIDAALMVASLVSPRTSRGFIDRFLVCCEAFHIPAILFFNKSDLLDTENMDLANELAQSYRDAGYEVYVGSALHDVEVNELRKSIQGKTIMETGHSGSGKSTLLNHLFPGAGAVVKEISASYEKGRHTTTFAEMYVMPDGTRIIDTPGIRDFGVVDIELKEVGQYFPEFREYLSQCKFNDCTHTNEPSCAVKAAVEDGKIPFERFESYLSILGGEDIFE